GGKPPRGRRSGGPSPPGRRPRGTGAAWPASPERRQERPGGGSSWSSFDEQGEARRAVAGAVDPLRGLLEIGGGRARDVDERLRVAVHEGEPRALDVDHDAVPPAEGVAHVGHAESDRLRLAGFEGLRLLEAPAELPAEGLAPQDRKERR